MATRHRRSWTDVRDGRDWEILYAPPVELDNRRVRRFRERLLLRSGGETLVVPAVFGSDLDTLTDEDLEGLLDQARRSAGSEAPPEPGAKPGGPGRDGMPG